VLRLCVAILLTGSKKKADYFEACLDTESYGRMPPESGPKEISNWLLGEVSRIINVTGSDIDSFGKRVNPERLCELALCARGVINIATAKLVLEEMFKSGRSPADIVQEKGLSQITDDHKIESEIAAVIANNPQAVTDYKAGKKQSLKFLVGQVMKATRGRASPQVVNELLSKKLGEE